MAEKWIYPLTVDGYRVLDATRVRIASAADAETAEQIAATCNAHHKFVEACQLRRRRHENRTGNQATTH